MSSILTAFAVGFLASCAAVLSLSSYWGSAGSLDTKELPLLRVAGFSISTSTSEIIVGQRLLNRVQIYDEKGVFVAGFFLRNRESRYQIVRLSDGGFIDCRTSSSGTSDLYLADGQFLSAVNNSMSDSICDQNFPEGTNSLSSKVANGEILGASNGLIFGKIISRSIDPLIESKVPTNFWALVLNPVLAGLSLSITVYLLIGVFNYVSNYTRNRQR